MSVNGDILERLENAANEEALFAQEQDFWHEGILREAKDTIASLRDEVERLKARSDKMHRRAQARRREV